MHLRPQSKYHLCTGGAFLKGQHSTRALHNMVFGPKNPKHESVEAQGYVAQFGGV